MHHKMVFSIGKPDSRPGCIAFIVQLKTKYRKKSDQLVKSKVAGYITEALYQFLF